MQMPEVQCALDCQNSSPKGLSKLQVEKVGQVKTIPLTQGKVALVDDADWGWLMQWKWTLLTGSRSDNLYAQRKVKEVCVLMHRLITDAEVGTEVDHRDKNGLNNQRYNLRVGSKNNNCWNRSAYSNNKWGMKGVHYSVRDKVFKSQIQVFGKGIYLGTFSSPEAAHEAYKVAAVKYHGEFARF